MHTEASTHIFGSKFFAEFDTFGLIENIFKIWSFLVKTSTVKSIFKNSCEIWCHLEKNIAFSDVFVSSGRNLTDTFGVKFRFSDERPHMSNDWVFPLGTVACTVMQPIWYSAVEYGNLSSTVIIISHKDKLNRINKTGWFLNTVNSQYNKLWENPQKVRYIGSSLNRELTIQRKTRFYCSQTIELNKKDGNGYFFTIVGNQCKCTVSVWACRNV